MYFASDTTEGNPQHPTVDQFTQRLVSSLVDGTKTANNLPTEDYQYYASFVPFKDKMDEFSRRILNLTQTFIHHERPRNTPLLEQDGDSVDDIADRFDQIVVDVVDGIVDRVDVYADEISGAAPKSNVVVTKTLTSPVYARGRTSDLHILHAKNVARPQLTFADPPDNSPNTPFIPKIRTKLNAKHLLDPRLARLPLHTNTSNSIIEGSLTSRPTVDFPPGTQFAHPYQQELAHLSFPPEVLGPVKETFFRPFDDTPYTFVDTLDKLRTLASLLDSVTEFAVDLEHHNYRSYHGFVCLMQISTRREDFLVDTLLVRSHMHLLNSSFTNPRIVKVLHGADSDIVWLQRDFGVYVVNMFDTGQAARVLEYPSAGLAYLLKYMCDVDADKKYQLADWRMRDLPAEMVKYAREDTHYLLYIYDRLRNELVNKAATLGRDGTSFALSVWQRSRDISLKKYEKEIVDEDAAINLYIKAGLALKGEHKKAFIDLFLWRDKIAREADESTRYVLPNNMLLLMCERLPSQVQDIIACCSPVPPLVRMHVHDILAVLTKAKTGDTATTAPTPAAAAAATQPTTFTTPSVPTPAPTPTPTPAPIQFRPIPATAAAAQPVIPPSRTTSATRAPVATPAPTTNTNSISTPQTGRFSPHTNTASPVLSTEQLYQTAGWLDAPSSPPSPPHISSRHHTSSGILSPSPRKTVLSEPPPGHRGSMFGDGDDEESYDRRRGQSTKLAAATVPKILFGNDDEASEDDDSDDEQARRTAELVRSSLAKESGFPSALRLEPKNTSSSSTSNPAPLPHALAEESSSSEEGEDDDDDAADDDDDDSFFNEDASSAKSGVDSGVDPEDLQDEVFPGDGSTAKKLRKVESAPGSPMKPRGLSPARATKPRSGSLSQEVPKSMAEIYQLSNQNRKRNKEKKKLKDEGLSAEHAIEIDDDEASDSAPHSDKGGRDGKRPKNQGADQGGNENAVTFMKEIGWLTKGHSQAPSSSGPAASGSQQGGHTREKHAAKGTHGDTSGESKAGKKHISPRGPRPVHVPPPHPHSQGPHGHAPHKAPPAPFVPFDYSTATSSFPTAVPHPAPYFNPYGGPPGAGTGSGGNHHQRDGHAHRGGRGGHRGGGRGRGNRY